MLKRYLILILLLSFGKDIFPQTDTTQLINEKLFQLIEGASEDIEDGQFYEIIEQLISNPIDINTATNFDLLKIPFLTPANANSIIRARKKSKGFQSVEELKLIKDLHPDLITILKPFIILSKVEQKEIPEKQKLYGIQFRTRFISDLQDRTGFSENKFSGNKIKSYNRIKANYTNFRLGLLTEKDPGENSYYDHFTGFIEYRPIGILDQIIIGDFIYEFGQGLVVWSPYAFSKGVQAVTSPLKRNRNFYANSSSEENKFFRGAALSLKFNDLNIKTFYSYHEIDATLNDLNEVNNFYLSGYHRTELEKSKKHLLNEQTFGLNINYYFRNFLKVGFLHFVNNYDKPFAHIDEQNLYGKNFTFSSLSYNFIYGNLSLIGETAYNSKSFASINNLSFNLHKDVELLISYRNYSANYFNTYANGFGESSNTQNEIGYYLGARINTDYGKLNFYYDIFRAPSESFYSDFPSTGNDFLLDFNSNIIQNTELTFKFKREEKETTFLNKLKNEVGDQIKSNYRIELKYKLTKSIWGKTRVEYVNYSLTDNSESGFLTYQELKYNIKDEISLVGRVILFDTKSYNTRLYEFENDLRGVMTNIPMFGEGFRWYILINYRIINDIKLYLKYSETFKPNLKSISSGNSEITGNVDNRISFQLDYSF